MCDDEQVSDAPGRPPPAGPGEAGGPGPRGEPAEPGPSGDPSEPGASPEPAEPHRTDRAGSPDRVVALTDGVFAIIVTLLVLEIAVPPELSDQSVRRVLSELRPTLVAWVISFLIAGMHWVAHRDLFAQIRAVNRDLVWLNVLFLLTASLIPFAAQVLGEYPDRALTLQLYGVVMVSVSVMRIAMSWYVARRPRLLWDPPDRRGMRIGLVVAATPIVVYVVAMAVAALSPPVSVALYFLVPLLYFLLVTFLRERPGTREEAEQLS